MKTAKEILDGLGSVEHEYSGDLCYAEDDVLQAMQKYANQSKWIPVSERLPE